MRCFKKSPEYVLQLTYLLCIFCMISNSCAENILVTKAETRITDDGYQLIADFDINLSEAANEALNHGISLYFISDLKVTNPRWYWMDGEISHSEQVTKLSYNLLTQQYRVGHNVLQQSFSNLTSALRVLGHQVAEPIPKETLRNGGGYLKKWFKWINPNKQFVASASMRLDISQLPKPLQVNALAGNDWDIHSEQYHWLIRIEDDNDAKGGVQ